MSTSEPSGTPTEHVEAEPEQSGPLPPPSDEPRRRLTARDLITVGVFAALYIVTYFVFAFVGFVNPVLMVVGLLAGLVVAGIPFMLFLTRVQRPGMIVLFTVLLGIGLLLTGHPPVAIGWMLLLSVICEVIVGVGRYRSRTAAAAAYSVFSLWVAGQFFPLFYDRAGYLSGPGMSQMSEEYLQSLDDLLSVRNLLFFDVAVVVCGLLGALLGLRLLDKHFRRAGLS